VGDITATVAFGDSEYAISANGRAGGDHARYAAFAAAPPTHDDPMTVGHYSGLPALLDGYHRAVRFWRTEVPAATLAVYVPV
jgi:hypothetical protein